MNHTVFVYFFFFFHLCLFVHYPLSLFLRCLFFIFLICAWNLNVSDHLWALFPQLLRGNVFFVVVCLLFGSILSTNQLVRRQKVTIFFTICLVFNVKLWGKSKNLRMQIFQPNIEWISFNLQLEERKIKTP